MLGRPYVCQPPQSCLLLPAAIAIASSQLLVALPHHQTYPQLPSLPLTTHYFPHTQKYHGWMHNLQLSLCHLSCLHFYPIKLYHTLPIWQGLTSLALHYIPFNHHSMLDSPLVPPKSHTLASTCWVLHHFLGGQLEGGGTVKLQGVSLETCPIPWGAAPRTSPRRFCASGWSHAASHPLWRQPPLVVLLRQCMQGGPNIVKGTGPVPHAVAWAVSLRQGTPSPC